VFKFLRKSKIAGAVAQVAVLFGTLDMTGIIEILPPKIAGGITVAAGFVAWLNDALNGESTGGN
jgi:hypothetical protein